jgi:hypothetical protein
MNADVTHDNVYATNNVYAGVLPITVDKDREPPYIQYSLVRGHDADATSPSIQDTGSSSPLPFTYDTTSSVPIFFVSLVFLEFPDKASSVVITPPQMNKLFLPKLHESVTLDSPLNVSLSWDSQRTDYSVWGDTISSPESARLAFKLNKQYILATSPVVTGESGAWFNSFKPGVMYLSLTNGLDSSPFTGVINGTKVGILSVTQRLALNKRVT